MSAYFLLSSAQNNSYVKVAYFRVAYSATLYQPLKLLPFLVKYISCKLLPFLPQGLPHQPGIDFCPLRGLTPHLSDGLLSCHLLWEASPDLPDYQIPLLEVVDSLAAFPSKHLSWTQLDIYL